MDNEADYFSEPGPNPFNEAYEDGYKKGFDAGYRQAAEDFKIQINSFGN